ncbi:hypothetical protein [Campylobacter geochelonis]|uniref:Uncharacterized protein n=1 Tax=Campylobacter geochelonis TaxID=1780362 RepID=A0A128EGA6_9BACT|nr:hypothetical protein [Campylobacter geochelonis]QKF70891.1 hypothetical protein CGEO_0568 [Campylobacter geochelonis]CZE47949.1 Uncharacterised protein [Campylobacter geochelonis]CZE51385.1 Uncharacterised protein [Campylobacter geochelonis]
MKSAKTIIEDIQRSPLYEKIRDLHDFYLLLSQTHQKIIAFIYQKDEILFIACKHNLGVQELKRDSNINNIKGLLKIFLSIKQTSSLRTISDIKFFVATKYMQNLAKKAQNLTKANELPPYVEKSEGKFQNRIEDPQIHAIFEEIRELIIVSR